MMWGVTFPTLSSASDGDVFFVSSFTDDRSHPATFNANFRSKISLYFLLLCGIIANGEIFKFYGGLCFMLSHLTMVANPCANFPHASTWISAIASSYNANEWGTLVTAASISSEVQSRPTETGHTTCAYCSNKFPPGAATLSILEILDLVTFHWWLHLAQLTPRVTAVGHHPKTLLTCFSTNFAERCTVLVLSI